MTRVPLFDHEVDSLVELRRVSEYLAAEGEAAGRQRLSRPFPAVASAAALVGGR